MEARTEHQEFKLKHKSLYHKKTLKTKISLHRVTASLYVFSQRFLELDRKKAVTTRLINETKTNQIKIQVTVNKTFLEEQAWRKATYRTGIGQCLIPEY